MSSRHWRAFFYRVFACLLLAAAPLYSQTTFGSIVGTVKDSSGAAIANTEVVLTNLGTNDRRTATTNSDGLYQFVNLPPAQYSVAITKTGFNKVLRSPITVQTETTTTINIALQVGDVSQTVEVTAQTPLLQTETSSLGQVIDQRKTNELPLNGRNPMNLVALVPSVVPQGQSMQNPNGTNPFAWGNFQIGGGMANQSTVWLDGSPVNSAYINLTSLVPTQDSLQEFKVSTSNLSPQYGRFAGGVVNFTTKSGTNSLHGAAWEYLRNKVLNANTFFNNKNGTPTGAFTQNQFGFNIGGPVVIPKLYNGKDKTFFFVNYEGFRLRQGASSTQTVPTAAERAGDLSALSQIYDPLTTCGTGAPGYPDCPQAQRGNRLPFAGNQIPANRINPTSLTYLKLYPLPNNPTPNGIGNWVGNASQGGNNNETVVHIDQNISEKQHLSGRYTYWSNLNLPIDPFGTGVCQDRCTETFTTNNFVLSDTYSFTPTLIMEVHASYQRFAYDRTPKTLGYDLTQLGWPASLNSQVAFRALPVPVINGFDTANTFNSAGTGSVITARNDNYRIAVDFTKIAGSHTLQFGGEWMRLTDNYAQSNVPSGILHFDPDFTAANGINTGKSGQGLATFLLGYPSSGNVGTPALVAAQQLYPAVYFNDSWHVTPRWTFNIGIRWEHAGPWTERYDRMTFFNPNRPNSVLASAGINVLGNIDLVNSTYDSYRSNIVPNWMQYAPRVGTAFQITQKTVFHAGYGIFWLPNDVVNSGAPNNDPINSIGTNIPSSGYPGIPGAVANNPFPIGILQPPGRNPQYAQILLGNGATENMLNNPYGYQQQWNADIQQEFGNGFLIDVAYGGAKGTHLPLNTQQIDQLPDRYLSMGNALTQTVANPFLSQLLPSASLYNVNGTVQVGQLLRPFPQYNGMAVAGSGIANSTYNSLQVKAEKRFSNGASILAAYTWAKLISDTDTLTGWLESGGTGGLQNYNNLRLEKSLASFDVPHRLVVSYIMDVPVGRGRKYLANSNGFVNAAVGGWGVGGTTTIQSGFPLHFGTNSNQTHSFGGGSRPNVVPGCEKSVSGSAQSRLDGWFNTDCFVLPAPYTFGSESRTDPNLRAAGIANWDFSAFKNFTFGESGDRYIQFRAEFFNLFNRTQFAFPGQSVGSSNYGIVTGVANQPRLVQFALKLNF
jgi:hypothetical protein